MRLEEVGHGVARQAGVRHIQLAAARFQFLESFNSFSVIVIPYLSSILFIFAAIAHEPHHRRLRRVGRAIELKGQPVAAVFPER